MVRLLIFLYYIPLPFKSYGTGDLKQLHPSGLKVLKYVHKKQAQNMEE
jgi:hypothetical protein